MSTAVVSSVIKVSGNWDQIQRFEGISAMEWKVINPKLPNRVELKCYDLAEGKYVYEMMRANGMVAFKNWLQ